MFTRIRTPLLALVVLPAWASIAGCQMPFGGGGGTSPPGSTSTTPPIVHPDWGATTNQTNAPPPISGGTLLVTQDGHLAVASDPDRDQIYVVDLVTHAVRATLALDAGDEPGRLVQETGTSRVHVALRGGGALATVDLATDTITQRRAVCPAPRGVGFDPTTGLVHVACAGGEFVSLRGDGGTPVRTLQFEPGLRDVVVNHGVVSVSRFRTTELEVVDTGGQTVPSRTSIASGFGDTTPGGVQEFTPTVAWRTIAMPSGQIAMVHQRSRTEQVEEQVTGGYGGGSGPNPCDAVSGIVHSTITLMDLNNPSTQVEAPIIQGAVLPVDIAVAPGGDYVAIAAAGNAKVPGADQVLEFRTESFRTPANAFPAFNGGESSGAPGAQDPVATADAAGCIAHPVHRPFAPTGQVTAVAYDADSNLLAQTREPAALWVSNSPDPIVLSTISREDSGHALFHGNAGAFIACASCHPEGGDDGHVWQFDTEGLRRTPALRGGILGTEPFHWQGDMPDFSHIVTTVFGQRMAGGTLRADQTSAMEHWVDRIPRAQVTSLADSAAVARGQVLFNDPTVACSSCHAGDHMTNNQTVDVGTHGMFQVPTLHGLAWRAPYMHNGCAPTLMDRFTSTECGGGESHGHTAHLSNGQLGDLIAYLQSI